MIKKVKFILKNIVNRFKKLSAKRKVIVILMLLATIVWGLGARKKEIPQQQIVSVERGKLIESISASGEVKAQETAEMSFQTSGKIAWIGPKEGDIVFKGQVLSSLDTTKQNADLQRARSDLRSAEATLERVLDEVKDHDADETFEQKETRTSAEVAKDKAFEAVIKAEKNLSEASLVSPLSGIVTNIPDGVVPGVNVSPATNVFTIVNPYSIYFEVEVNELDVPKISIGQVVQIEIDAYPGEEIEGKVFNIDFTNSTTSTGGTAYKVKVNLPKNDGPKFRLGMGGDADFIIDIKEATLLIPIAAVVEDTDSNFVWLVGEDDRIKRREVEIGTSSIDEIEILLGLVEGDRIISQPSADLNEGDTPISPRGAFRSLRRAR